MTNPLLKVLPGCLHKRGCIGIMEHCVDIGHAPRRRGRATNDVNLRHQSCPKHQVFCPAVGQSNLSLFDLRQMALEIYNYADS